MLATKAALLGMALWLGGTTGPPPVSPGEFRGWFEAAARGRLHIPEAVERAARDYRFVFVGGFEGERLAGYFAQNARELRAHGVPRRAIHVLWPSSRRTVEENRAAVRGELLRLAAAGDERLVVIAHSRGACDALAFALHEPEFVRDRVAALFLVQGPFGGTGLADYVLRLGPPLDRRMPPLPRLVAHLLGRWETARLSRGRLGGLTGLSREASRAYWGRLVEEHADALPAVGPKVYFIATRGRPARWQPFRRAMARYLGTYFGPNDGLVATVDQALPGLGTRLGVLPAGHADLTCTFPASGAGRRSRRALIQSILMAIGRSGAFVPEGP